MLVLFIVFSLNLEKKTQQFVFLVQVGVFFFISRLFKSWMHKKGKTGTSPAASRQPAGVQLLPGQQEVDFSEWKTS